MLKSDIIVSVSTEEGLSTIIREAMFLKKCIIATNIDGHLGVLTNNENALIYELGDNMDGLICLLRNAVSSKYLRDELGVKANQFYIDNLKYDIYKKRIEMFFDDLFLDF